MRRQLTLLDGGLGQLLKQRGVLAKHLGLKDEYLALTVAPVDNPGVVRGAHLEYIQAGADVITTGNYATTVHHLRKTGQPHRLEELTEAAALCAKDAVRISGKPVQIAGSMPPLKDSYRTKDLGSAEDIKNEYMTIAKVLAPNVDFMLCETLSCVKEAVAAVEAARSTGLPVWVSFSLEDSLDAVLRSKEPLVDALHRVWEGGPVDAFLVNCCCPEAVTAAIPILKQFTEGVHADGGPTIGAYPNAYQLTTTEWMAGAIKPSITNPDNHGEDGFLTPEGYCCIAQNWFKSGVQIIGGCCGTTPEHTRALYEAFRPGQ